MLGHVAVLFALVHRSRRAEGRPVGRSGYGLDLSKQAEVVRSCFVLDDVSRADRRDGQACVLAAVVGVAVELQMPFAGLH